MAANPQGCRPAAYARRRPEQTVLYRLVQQHPETYLALACEGDWDRNRVPAAAEREFSRYLECGILACGFCRARCPACGHDFLVAFSCKGRAVCPSCNARRMAQTAAHLVDHVFPPLPVRQFAHSPALLATRVQAIARPNCVVGRLNFQSFDHAHHKRTKGIISPLPGRRSRTETERT